MRISRTERAKTLKPVDEWFGSNFEEAPIKALRDAQFISLRDKLIWLEEAHALANKSSEKKED